MIRELPFNRSFIVFLDCDGTLTESEGSWLALHREFNTEEFRDRQLARYLENEITFNEWTYNTAEKWKGHDISAVENIFNINNLVNDYNRAVDEIKSLGGIVGIVSAGVEQFVKLVGQEGNVDFVVSNPLGVNSGKLNGNIKINVDNQNKHDIYKEIICLTSISVENSVMVGDSIHDVQKLHHNNLSIVFNPGDEKISDEVDFVIHDNSLAQIVPPIREWLDKNKII